MTPATFALDLLLSTFLFAPLGVICGAVTERVAYRHWLQFVHPDPAVWNGFSRIGSALLAFLLLLNSVRCLPVEMEEGDKGYYMSSALGFCYDPISADLLGHLSGLDVTTRISATIRICAFALGCKFGEALQPVGLTGGIACGKSTVSKMLRQKRSHQREPGRKEDETESCSDWKRGSGAFAVVDLDTIAHDVLIPGKMGSDSAYEKVVAAFGTGILCHAGETAEDVISERVVRRKSKEYQDDTGEGKDVGEIPNNGNGKALTNGIKESPPNPSELSPPQDGPLHIDRRKLGDIIFRSPTKRRTLNRITHPLITKVMMKSLVREKLYPSEPYTEIVSADIPLLFEIGLRMKVLFGLVVVVACAPGQQLERMMDRNPDLTKEQCVDRIQSQIDVEQKARMADVVIRNGGTLEELVAEVESAREEVIRRVKGWGLTCSSVLLGLAMGLWVCAIGTMFLSPS